MCTTFEVTKVNSVKCHKTPMNFWLCSNWNYNFTDKKKLKILTTFAKSVWIIFHMKLLISFWLIFLNSCFNKNSVRLLKAVIPRDRFQNVMWHLISTNTKILMKKPHFNKNLTETFYWCALYTSWLKGFQGRKFLS